MNCQILEGLRTISRVIAMGAESSKASSWHLTACCEPKRMTQTNSKPKFDQPPPPPPCVSKSRPSYDGYSFRHSIPSLASRAVRCRRCGGRMPCQPNGDIDYHGMDDICGELVVRMGADLTPTKARAHRIAVNLHGKVLC